MSVMSASIYDCKTARFDGDFRYLSEDDMRRVAPSIFAREAHSSRSERFRPIATVDLLQGLQREGFYPVAVKQGTTRDASKREFTKHLIRLRKNDGVRRTVGDTIHEVMLKNGNDGTACYELFSGMYRVQCSNSLVALAKGLSSVKIYHKGQDIQDRVIEGTYRVLGESELALAAPQDWSQIQTTNEQRQVFADAAHRIRFADHEGNIKTPIRAAQMLIARRQGDTANDFWTVWNRVQEAATKGGLSAMGTGSNGRPRQFTTKMVNNIEGDVKLNASLFQLGQDFADFLKSRH